MAAVTTNDVTITIAFADATTRNIKFSGVDGEALLDVSDKVIAINANFPPSVATTFVSAIGAHSTMITKAVITSTTEDVIYSD